MTMRWRGGSGYLYYRIISTIDIVSRSEQDTHQDQEDG